MKNPLDRIEARLQSLIEKGASRLFPGAGQQSNLAQQLVQVMRDATTENELGEIIAPNRYIIFLHPTQIEPLRENQALLNRLSDIVKEAALSAGIHLTGDVTLSLEEASHLQPDQTIIRPQTGHDSLPDTMGIEIETEETGLEAPFNCFLIVNGTQTFILDRPVINIGRRPDNNLVIEDARVSRLHAQLRVIRGQFVIFDLGSTGGTCVNNNRISQAPLFPGDVISLAGVPLIFGQDPIPPSETQRLPDAGETDSKSEEDKPK